MLSHKSLSISQWPVAFRIDELDSLKKSILVQAEFLKLVLKFSIELSLSKVCCWINKIFSLFLIN